jgi:hypothetical protein
VLEPGQTLCLSISSSLVVAVVVEPIATSAPVVAVVPEAIEILVLAKQADATHQQKRHYEYQQRHHLR